MEQRRHSNTEASVAIREVRPGTSVTVSHAGVHGRAIASGGADGFWDRCKYILLVGDLGVFPAQREVARSFLYSDTRHRDGRLEVLATVTTLSDSDEKSNLTCKG